MAIKRFTKWLWEPVSNAPLATFRVLFGLAMVYGAVRFWASGWIEDHFINTRVQFKYYGFEWVGLLPPEAMYVLYGAMFAGALGIALGLWYRFSALLFFLAFTYAELIDLTYYLNHYYFVSLVSLLLVIVPAQRRFSIDCLLWPGLAVREVPRWAILVFQVQIALVYLYAGLAKINSHWLIEAMPLRIWLPAQNGLPLIGPLFEWPALPWVFAWAGMLYDTTIVFWLCWAKSRPWAYLSVLVFHGLTAAMFQIGIFPLVMVVATWIYFPPGFHEDLLRRVQGVGFREKTDPARPSSAAPWRVSLLSVFLFLYLGFQVLFPWRYLLYPGDVFWTEEGYRFSWRVMLMEKAGTATFYVKDRRSGREGIVDNREFLRPHQEKQMAMQPDLILQFAHFLKRHYEKKGVYKPQVRVEAYVTLNGRPSRLLIDPQLDLTGVRDTWTPKKWILHYE